MDHPLQCRCGALRGFVSHPEKANRGVCYCKDCQAFAHFLGKADEVLDAAGGTEVVAALPKHVRLTQGIENLACMSLSPKGLLRWYACCCSTPIANTVGNYKFSYVGLASACLGSSERELEQAFGPVRLRVNTQSACGQPKPRPMVLSMLAIMPPFMLSLLRTRVDGSYRHTPFFDEGGKPVAERKVLSRSEREALNNQVLRRRA